jgi:signal transduction histidine kinase
MVFMPDRFDRVTARFLTARYALALLVVAVLSVAAQVAVQATLRRQEHDAGIINLAGRQRMLSQRLSKAALAWRWATEGDVRAGYRIEMTQVLEEWRSAHARLSHGLGEDGMGADNSPAVAMAFAELEPVFTGMVAAAQAVERDAGAVAALLVGEPQFLRRMEAIVRLYQDEAAARVRRLQTLELVLCGVLLLVLACEALWVFRPAVHRLRVAIADRERLRDQEQANRELSVAAEVARGIGQDLHDGVGQTLTALSFQAKAAERALAGSPVQARLVELHAGVSEAIAQVRAAARRLCPVDIQVAGLDAALRELAVATSRVSGAECTVSGELPETPPGAEDLFRIVQESITNALRHGRATSIAVRLAQDGNQGCLEIADNGEGGPGGAEGVGLRSMRHRIQRLRGTLEAGPQSSGGWLVRCRFPLDGNSGMMSA